MLMDLAERKLGPSATIRVTREGWIAEGRTRVYGKTRDALEQRLNALPDVESAALASVREAIDADVQNVNEAICTFRSQES